MDEIPRLAVDRMLGRLARWLRILGADVMHGRELYGSAIAELARRDERRVITRDKRLRTFPGAIFVESNQFREQLRETCAQVSFNIRGLAFSRCSRCNEPLIVVARELIKRRVPPFVYASQERFAECGHCGRVYWPATHSERIIKELQAIGLSIRG